MKAKQILIILIVVDLLLFVQVLASTTISQAKSETLVHSGLNRIVYSMGFRRYKRDHFPLVAGSINTSITFQKGVIVGVEIDSSSITNKQFISAFLNLLQRKSIPVTNKSGVVVHRFFIAS